MIRASMTSVSKTKLAANGLGAQDKGSTPSSTPTPFRPLGLNCDDDDQLRGLADLFVNRALKDYERFLTDDHRELKPEQWRLLKQRDAISVFQERSAHDSRESIRTSRAMSMDSHLGDRMSSATATSTAKGGGGEHHGGHSVERPVLIATGRVACNLGDIMYGAVNPTLEDMRVQSAFLEDQIISAAVLATIERPSHDHPFSSLTIKWTLRRQPLLLKHRDAVFIEATGLAKLPQSQETVGFHLVHSVAFPEAPVLEAYHRDSLSICSIFRQRGSRVVEVHMKGCFEARGNVQRSIGLKAMTETMLGVPQLARCAEMKKISFALQRRHDSILGLEDSFHIRRHRAHRRDFHGCAICSRSFGRALRPAFAINHRKRHGTPCRLCLEVVCVQCCRPSAVVAVAPHGALYRQQITFCVDCESMIHEVGALEVARAELSMPSRRKTSTASNTTSRSTTSSICSLDRVTLGGSDLSGPAVRLS